MSYLSSIYRIGGLATGIDTDDLVKKLMTAERIPLDKLAQKKQLLGWKKDNYREITNLVRGLKDSYFSVLKPASNMTSSTPYKKFATASSDTTLVTVTANADAMSGSHTIEVKQFAQAAGTSGTINGTTATDTDYSADTYSFGISLDGGATQTIALRNGTYASTDDLVYNSTDGLQKLINDAVGAGKVSVSVDAAGQISFASLQTVVLTDGASSALTKLGSFANNSTNIAAVKDPLMGTAAADLTFGSTDNQFKVTLDGVTKTITLRDGTYASSAELVTNTSGDGIQDLLNKAFGSGKIEVSQSAGILTFTAPKGKVTLESASSNDALGKLYFTSGDSNRLNTSETLESLKNKFATNLTFGGAASDELAFTINDQPFTFKNTDKLSYLMSTINSSSAGVTIRYNEVNDTFTMISNQKGEGSAIEITNTTGNFFGASSASNIASTTISNGLDAKFDLDGISNIQRSDNNFTIDGVTYALTDNGSVLPQSATVTLTLDVNGIYDNIQSFVDKYNEVIANIYGELEEEKFNEYLPLTEEQKESLSEGEIENWEEKAKSGILRNDSILRKLVNDWRKGLFDSITGISGNLASIGITTSPDYRSEKGKLIIDESKLKAAITANPEKVRDLFSKKSSTSYSPDLSAADRQTRYNEQGVAYRLLDIIEDNIRTSRDSNGKKGFLLERAGIVGDITEFQNFMDSEIDRVDEDIVTMIDRLTEKEEAYYRKFTAMEKAIAMLNSQGEWLSSQLGQQQ